MRRSKVEPRRREVYSVRGANCPSCFRIVLANLLVPHKKGRVIPVLTFAADEKHKQLISSDGGSWLREYVSGFPDDLLPE